MKEFYTKKQFMELAGIKNRSRLHQVLRGYNSKGYSYPPILEEGKDFICASYVFFPSAFEKLKTNRPNKNLQTDQIKIYKQTK